MKQNFLIYLLLATTIALAASTVYLYVVNAELTESLMGSQEVAASLEAIDENQPPSSPVEGDALVKQRKLNIEQLAETIVQASDTVQVASILRDAGMSDPSIQYIYYCTADGDMTVYPHQVLPADYNPTDRPWYVEAERSPSQLDSYQDVTSGQFIVTYNLAVYRDDAQLGVIGIDYFVAAPDTN